MCLVFFLRTGRQPDCTLSDTPVPYTTPLRSNPPRRYAARPSARPRTVANPRKDRTMIRAVIFSASAIALVVPAAAQPAAKVAAANKAALQEPSSAGFIHAVQVYPYTEGALRSEEHTSELQSLMRISYAVFCLKKKKTQTQTTYTTNQNKYDN